MDNADVSNLASDYEPDHVGADESSEYGYEFQSSLKKSKSIMSGTNTKKKGAGKTSMTKSKPGHSYLHQSSSLSLTRQKSGRSNSRRNKGMSSMQKFNTHGFSNDDFEYQNLTASRSRRRQQQDGAQSLNNIFMEIIDRLWNMEDSFIFRY